MMVKSFLEGDSFMDHGTKYSIYESNRYSEQSTGPYCIPEQELIDV